MSKKAVYTFLYYPECGSIDNVVAALAAFGDGWNYAISPLHDKDLKEDGTPKKAHYHVLIGFEKNAPTYRAFCEAVKGISEGCAVPPAKDCTVRDPLGAVAYLTHKNQPDKSQYAEDGIIFSEFWDVDAYCTKDQRAEHRRTCKRVEKEDRDRILGYCMDWLSDRANFCEYCALLDHIRAEHPEMFGTVLENSYIIKSYADSKRHSLHDETVVELEKSRDEAWEETDRLVKQNTDMLNCSAELWSMYK